MVADDDDGAGAGQVGSNSILQGLDEILNTYTYVKTPALLEQQHSHPELARLECCRADSRWTCTLHED